MTFEFDLLYGNLTLVLTIFFVLQSVSELEEAAEGCCGIYVICRRGVDSHTAVWSPDELVPRLVLKRGRDDSCR